MKNMFLTSVAVLLSSMTLQAGTFQNPYEGFRTCETDGVHVAMATWLSGGFNSKFEFVPYTNSINKVHRLKIDNREFLQELVDKKLAAIDADSALDVMNLDRPVMITEKQGSTSLRRSVIAENLQQLVIKYERIVPQVLKCVKTKEVPFFGAIINQCVESVEVSPEVEVSSATLRLDLKACLDAPAPLE